MSPVVVWSCASIALLQTSSSMLHKKSAALGVELETRSTMFAVIKTGGKQYKVAAKDEIVIMTLPGEAGSEVTFDQVLSYSDGASFEIGAPLVAGATVAAEIVTQKRGPKVIAFKKRRRQNSKRKRGHRQDLTVVRITEILLAGQERKERVSASADVPAAHSPEAAVAEAGVA